MTETGGVTCRRTYPGTVIGTVGKTIAGTKVKLLDEQGNEVTKPNTKGVCWHYGPHIMKGYYKEEQKTKEVLKDGWLNSGDILVYTANGELKFAGRAKDTIVLFGGENVEPTPIEEKMKESEFIDHVMLVSRAFGEDQKVLGALIVPNADNLADWAKKNGVSGDFAALIKDPKVHTMYRHEINKASDPAAAEAELDDLDQRSLLGAAQAAEAVHQRARVDMPLAVETAALDFMADGRVQTAQRIGFLEIDVGEGFGQRRPFGIGKGRTGVGEDVLVAAQQHGEPVIGDGQGNGSRHGGKPDRSGLHWGV